MVDAPAPTEQASERAPVDPPRPGEVARAVVLLGPLRLEERLGPAVAPLLPPVGAHGAPPVLPHDGRRAEAERPSPLLELPAHVDVVPGHPELRVESADRAQCLTPEG